MNQTQILPPSVSRIGRNALVIGIIALALGAVGFFIDQERFFQSYLFGYMYALQFPLGCLGLLTIHHLAGGRWGYSIRRFLEAGILTFPLMAVLIIPIVVGMGTIFPWINPEEHYALLDHKAPYLNVPFFIGRMVFYFVVWTVIGLWLNQQSVKQESVDVPDPKSVARLKRASAIGLILFMLTATFAVFDWMMSLQPFWFSSIYGVIYLAGTAIAAMSFSLLVGNALKNHEPISELLTIDLFSDLSNFLLAFVSFWAYVSFSQYLIIYSANLPEEITWYAIRGNGGWGYFALALVFFAFALPFGILLSKSNKRVLKLMVSLAMFLLFMRSIDLFWHIMPAFYETVSISWLDFVMPIGLTGVWLWFFIMQLNRKPLVVRRDPRFQEVPAHG
ncbi:MAG: hypothetical protein KDJ65_14915 [Anaerolineae bacterium]|nr:hypothetical protein [Anaerolineae bacterium]